MTSNQTPSTFRMRIDRLLLRFARNWLRIVVVVIGIYATLPVVAPIMMNAGLQAPARVIYTLYSPFCHQFAFRSFFIGGEQPVYPRELAGTDYQPYEAFVSGSPFFESVGDPRIFSVELMTVSRAFIGDRQMGYKTALCQRDVAIYWALFAGGLIYLAAGRRIRPVPIWLYVILGLGPIGIDGFSQLLGYPPFELWEARETTPVFRVVTGTIFGFMNAWLIFPHLDRAMMETKYEIEGKLDGNPTEQNAELLVD